MNAIKRSSLLALAAAAALVLAGGAAAQHKQAGPYRILHVMSYHASMLWAGGQFAAFQEGMGDAQVEYKVLEMDILRDRSPENLQRKAREARALIESWKPHLVYATDDAAQEHVSAHYAGKSLPFVFSGVNRDPKVYGLAGALNVAGVIEHEHFVESVRLLRAVAPGVKRIAAVFDPSPHWDVLRERMRAGLAELPEVQIVAWDVAHTWPEYQRKVAGYQSTADAIAIIGFFDYTSAGITDREVLRWTAENSRLPDFSLWDNRVRAGILSAVTVSDREQGLLAGRMARSILLEGKSPASFPMHPTKKGVPTINLARAHKLGLKPKSSVLLSANVVEKFDWEKQ